MWWHMGMEQDYTVKINLLCYTYPNNLWIVLLPQCSFHSFPQNQNLTFPLTSLRVQILLIIWLSMNINKSTLPTVNCTQQFHMCS